MDLEKLAKLQEMIDNSHSIVFFGGAGVSTESGIPDFRSVDGLYNQKYDYPPETILSHSFYMKKKDEFYRFYRDKILVTEGKYGPVKPNAAHLKLAELEKAGKLSAVVTQNIDGLHQLAGSKVVYELHGTIMRNFCEHCGKEFDVDYMRSHEGVPKCDECGSDIKPDVVLYEEGLDDNTVSGAINAIKNADMLIIGGTSLVVYPAAGFINYYRGNRLVMINKSSTSADASADLVINDSIGEVLGAIRV